MCNNNGHCRKFDAGAMCPSCRVTRDDQHLPRGRANTLQLALSGQLEGGLTANAVADALDPCVGCKGCKSDGPTGVDMEKVKLEFSAQRAAARGLPLLQRLIARLPDLAPVAGRLPWLFNLRGRLPGAAALSERWPGLSAKRSLPRWRRDTFAAPAPGLRLASRAQVLEAAWHGRRFRLRGVAPRGVHADGRARLQNIAGISACQQRGDRPSALMRWCTRARLGLIGSGRLQVLTLLLFKARLQAIMSAR